MKFFIVFALCVVVASAHFIVPDAAAAEAAEIKEIIAMINHPSTDPATAAALMQLLHDILGIPDSPISVGPAIIDESPISVGPVIVDEIEDSPIHVEPVIIDESPISVGPVIVDEVGVDPAPSSSPLVQIIINVNSGAVVVDSPVADNPVEDKPVEDNPITDIPSGPPPSPVIEDESDVIQEDSVIVVDEPVFVEETIIPEQVIIAPVVPAPVVVLPDTLN